MLLSFSRMSPVQLPPPNKTEVSFPTACILLLIGIVNSYADVQLHFVLFAKFSSVYFWINVIPGVYTKLQLLLS